MRRVAPELARSTCSIAILFNDRMLRAFPTTYFGAHALTKHGAEVSIYNLAVVGPRLACMGLNGCIGPGSYCPQCYPGWCQSQSIPTNNHI